MKFEIIVSLFILYVLLGIFGRLKPCKVIVLGSLAMKIVFYLGVFITTALSDIKKVVEIVSQNKNLDTTQVLFLIVLILAMTDIIDTVFELADKAYEID